MDKQAINSHMAGAKHRKLAAVHFKQITGIADYFAPETVFETDNANQKILPTVTKDTKAKNKKVEEVELHKAEASSSPHNVDQADKAAKRLVKEQKKFDGFVLNDDVTRAKILWAMKMIVISLYI